MAAKLFDEPISPELVLIDPELRSRLLEQEEAAERRAPSRQGRVAVLAALALSGLAAAAVGLVVSQADARPALVASQPRAVAAPERKRPAVRPVIVVRPVRRAAAPQPKVRETEPGSSLIGPLPDPTPPDLRLAPTVARELLRVSRRSRLDWAALLAAARSRGAVWTDARPARLAALARQLGSEQAPPEEAALARFHRAVGLDGLVSGLGAARWVLGARVLRDPRIEIHRSGRSDVAAGRVDVRVLALLLYLARTEGHIAVSSLVSGHAPPGDGSEPSAHAFGAAVDIRAVGRRPVFGNQAPGGPVDRAVRNMLLLPPEVRPQQVISLLALGGPSVALADHDRFVHVGFDSTVAAEGDVALELLWRTAGAVYGVPWEVLGAINEIETMNGRLLRVSSAGALGWMQFMPGTWRAYGVDADGNGHADPWNPADAIFSAANYLQASGAPGDLRRALFAYNPAGWYVDDVLARARRIEAGE